ncbi:tyrosine-type recombinase/integrase [Paenibacillus urinalis]|uniref:Site-specific integrase n=1 Tax=Paenibacillus urinalis TaxID=521520 RepID=A0AAX3N2P8_9BACL|nr:site-specific integrase [Paenibacillus urinalis]WDH83299.1 site-specific integrase [Paenibacillus urinalis]
MEQDMKTTPPSSLETEEETKESFRQNASFAEKILQDESIFARHSDDYDIRKMSRGRIENMLYGVERQELTPVDQSYEQIGRKGINKWLWGNLVEPNISILVFKGYLQHKLKQDAWGFYQEYKTIVGFVQLAADFYQTSAGGLTDQHVLSQDFIQHAVETSSKSREKKIISFLLKRAGLYGSFQINNFDINPIPRKMTVVHPKVQDYIKQLEREGKSRHTLQNHFFNVSRLLTWLSNNVQIFSNFELQAIPLLQIKTGHLEDFRLHLKKKAHNGEYSLITVSECIYCIKSFFRFLNKRFGNPDPSRKLKSISAPRYRFRMLPSQEQLNTFFDVIARYSDDPLFEQVAFRLMLDLGFRGEEVAQVSLEDINLNTRTIAIHSKGGEEHLLPLAGKLYEDLSVICNKHPTTKYLMGNDLKAIQNKLRNNYHLYALIADWTFPGGLHLFRHTFITRLANKGILPQALKELGRFKKIDTISLYLHIAQYHSTLTNEVNKLHYH